MQKTSSTDSNNFADQLQSAAQAKEAKPQTGFCSLLAVKRVFEKQTSRGTPMLFVDLGDKTSGFTVSIFDNNPYFEFFKTQAIEGSVVLMMGRSNFYQDRFSPEIVEVRKLEAEELAQYPCDNLVPTSKESPESLWKEFQEHIAKIEDEKLRDTVNHVMASIETQFKVVPAGISMHHAYRHGLMEHTVHLLRIVDRLAPLYPEVDAGLARAGAALHDIGKIFEYDHGAFTSKFGREGILFGHSVIAYRMAREAGQKEGLHPIVLERLEHLILSHQGAREFGAAAIAATPEAIFVHYCDNLDAKMGAVQKAMSDASAGQSFTDERVGALDTKLLVEPLPEQSEKSED